MVKDIIKDVLFLSVKSKEATRNDLSVGTNLTDTLAFHKGECVGLAANMIGESKRIIAFSDRGRITVMYNPVILKKSGEYQTEEGCLSLQGKRETKRYRTITVEWKDACFKRHKAEFTGFTAEIIQHEVDHLEGIII